MSKMKEIDDIAQGIADVTKELMYDSIDWQLADQNVVGDDYNALHSYVMRKAIGGREEELGFKLDRRRSRRHHPVILTDTDFADDIAITTEEISQAQEMLKCIEIEAAKVGLHLNAKKTEVMHFNQEGDATIKTRNGNALKSVDNFKYLGCWMKSTDKDFEIRKALAWSACHKNNSRIYTAIRK